MTWVHTKWCNRIRYALQINVTTFSLPGKGRLESNLLNESVDLHQRVMFLDFNQLVRSQLVEPEFRELILFSVK